MNLGLKAIFERGRPYEVDLVAGALERAPFSVGRVRCGLSRLHRENGSAASCDR